MPTNRQIKTNLLSNDLDISWTLRNIYILHKWQCWCTDVAQHMLSWLTTLSCMLPLLCFHRSGSLRQATRT